MIGFEKLFRYDGWANRETLASLERAGGGPPAALRRIAHVLAAERLWLVRLTRDSARVVVWPDLSLAECGRELDELAPLWGEYLARLTPTALADTVSYVNSKGESWSSTVEDVLMHVILHSGYHRGQIVADLRESGAEPAYTDYIHAVRRGLVEREP